jgi:hypothetical protein
LNCSYFGLKAFICLKYLIFDTKLQFLKADLFNLKILHKINYPKAICCQMLAFSCFTNLKSIFKPSFILFINMKQTVKMYSKLKYKLYGLIANCSSFGHKRKNLFYRLTITIILRNLKFRMNLKLNSTSVIDSSTILRLL